MVLEIERDAEGGWEQLFGVILSDLEPEPALQLLKRFDREWFLFLDAASLSLLNFTVDLHGPV